MWIKWNSSVRFNSDWITTLLILLIIGLVIYTKLIKDQTFQETWEDILELVNPKE